MVQSESEQTTLCLTYTCTHTQISSEIQHGMSQEQYLYSGGWQTEHLHEQLRALKCMTQFQAKQNHWQNKRCKVCNEQWSTRSHLNTDPYICNRCQHDKYNPKLYSAEDDMDPVLAYKA